jgi:two-component system torCAD operon response regulator TorR
MSTQIRLLVVEDDPALRALLIAYLEKDNYRVEGASTAAEAEKLLGSRHYAMILLDLGLPDEDGLVVARRLRTKSTVPIIFVTQRSGDADRIIGLEMGADDYIVKPFNPRELSARVRNILNRTSPMARDAQTEAPIAIGSWRLDLGKRLLRDGEGKQLAITRAEFDILRSLSAVKGRVQSRDALLDAIGSSSSDDVSDRTIDVLISRLRKKIEADPRSPRIILTVPGVGYRLDL